jgi:hypothetical protein
MIISKKNIVYGVKHVLCYGENEKKNIIKSRLYTWRTLNKRDESKYPESRATREICTHVKVKATEKSSLSGFF